MGVSNRALDQRREALSRANHVRAARSKLKQQVKAGELTTTAVLRNPPPEIAGMKVYDLLICTPRIGHTKAIKMLRRTNTPASMPVGTLVERPRKMLVEFLDGR